MPIRAHWSDQYRTQRKNALRLCKECHAPNKPARRSCWKCGGAHLSARGYDSRYWVELWNRAAQARELDSWSDLPFEKVTGASKDKVRQDYYRAGQIA